MALKPPGLRHAAVIQVFVLCVQALKGHPPPTLLFGEDEDDDGLDWMK